MAKSKTTTTTEEKEIKRTECPISKQDFLDNAKPMLVKIGEASIVVGVKEFATGSFGWYGGEKVVIDIGGVPCKVQVGVNLTLVGSKPQE